MAVKILLIFLAVSFNWRMFAGTWSLMMIVLSNSYTTALISDSTVIKMKPIPNSFEELAQDPSRKLVIERVMLGDSILVGIFLVPNPSS